MSRVKHTLSTSLLDNGAVLTLGVVGVVAAAGAFAGRRGSRALSESQAKAVARKVVDALGGEDEAEEQVCYPMYLGDGAPAGSEEARGYARAEAKLIEMVERFGGSRDDLAEVYSAMTYIINPSG
jgi:hypothetical protein